MVLRALQASSIARGRAWQGKRLIGHDLNVTHVEWSPDDQMIASASFDNTVRVWEMGSWKCVATLQGHTNYVFSAVVSPDGRYVVSGSSDHTVRVWGP